MSAAAGHKCLVIQALMIAPGDGGTRDCESRAWGLFCICVKTDRNHTNCRRYPPLLNVGFTTKRRTAQTSELKRREQNKTKRTVMAPARLLAPPHDRFMKPGPSLIVAVIGQFRYRQDGLALRSRFGAVLRIRAWAPVIQPRLARITPAPADGLPTSPHPTWPVRDSWGGG